MSEERATAGQPLPWVIARCRPRAGDWNMAADIALLEHTVATGQPVLRLYAFRPATMTLGRSEDAERVPDRAACAAAGIGIARRPTGGRAVLHDEELTYCVTVPQTAAGRASPAAGREAVAQVVGERLCEALQTMGVSADIVRSTAPPRATGGYRSCFASASRWEVAVGGRKIVGSAQRRWPQATLQHGSFLLGPGFRRLPAFLRGAAPLHAAAQGELARATCVAEARDAPATWEEAADAISAVWTRHAPVGAWWDELPPALAARADELVARGVTDPAWPTGGARGGTVEPALPPGAEARA